MLPLQVFSNCGEIDLSGFDDDASNDELFGLAMREADDIVTTTPVGRSIPRTPPVVNEVVTPTSYAAKRGDILAADSDFQSILTRIKNVNLPAPQGVDQIEFSIEIYEQIQRQVGEAGHYYRALRPSSGNSLDNVIARGGVDPDTYFSSTRTPAHIGHNGGSVYLRCAGTNPRCRQYFENNSSETGSGVQNDHNIPLSDLEVIVPDYRAAVQAAFNARGAEVPAGFWD